MKSARKSSSCLEDISSLMLYLFVSDPVLQFLLSGLQHPQLATAAANSLQNISSQCRSHMANHLDGLLQIVQAVDTFSVSDDAAIGLLKGKFNVMCLNISSRIGFAIL